MPKGLPDDVLAEIAGKREPSSEDDTKNGDEPKKDEKPKADEPKKDEPKKGDKPEPKKGEAAKPKTNGQSIAQVAEAANDDEDDEDEDEDEDGDDPKGDTDKSKKPKSSLFKEFISVKRELKDQSKVNKQNTKQYQELAGAMTELIDMVKDLKGNKTAQKDEIEEFAEEWGLDKEGTKKLVSVLEKRLSTKFKPNKEDDADEDEDEPKTAKKSDDKKSELKARQVELAIEGEYEDYLDSYPQLKDRLNLKAIKRYIIGDDENLAKSFDTIVNEMYPGILKSKGSVDGGADGIGAGEDDDDKTDFNDPKVLSQLDKNPKLKEKYHDDLITRVKSLRK